MKSINTFFIHSDYHLLDIDLVRDLPPSLRSNFSSQIWMGDFRNASPRSASCTALDDTSQLNSVSLSLKGAEIWRDEKTPATERLHYSHKEENRKIATFDFLGTSKIISSFFLWLLILDSKIFSKSRANLLWNVSLYKLPWYWVWVS